MKFKCCDKITNTTFEKDTEQEMKQEVRKRFFEYNRTIPVESRENTKATYYVIGTNYFIVKM